MNLKENNLKSIFFPQLNNLKENYLKLSHFLSTIKEFKRKLFETFAFALHNLKQFKTLKSNQI